MAKRRRTGSGTGSRTGHSRYREQRARARRRAVRNNEPCCFCGQAIDYEAAWPDPWSWTADHEQPTSKGGANYGPGVRLRSAHARCNTSASNRHWSGSEDGRSDRSEPEPVKRFDAPELRGSGWRPTS